MRLTRILLGRGISAAGATLSLSTTASLRETEPNDGSSRYCCVPSSKSPSRSRPASTVARRSSWASSTAASKRRGRRRTGPAMLFATPASVRYGSIKMAERRWKKRMTSWPAAASWSSKWPLKKAVCTSQWETDWEPGTTQSTARSYSRKAGSSCLTSRWWTSGTALTGKFSKKNREKAFSLQSYHLPSHTTGGRIHSFSSLIWNDL